MFCTRYACNIDSAVATTTRIVKSRVFFSTKALFNFRFCLMHILTLPPPTPNIALHTLIGFCKQFRPGSNRCDQIDRGTARCQCNSCPNNSSPMCGRLRPDDIATPFRDTDTIVSIHQATLRSRFGQLDYTADRSYDHERTPPPVNHFNYLIRERAHTHTRARCASTDLYITAYIRL